MFLKFGALSPKLTEQVPGLPEHFDDKARAVTMLRINGILTSAESTKAINRIGKLVMAWCKENGRFDNE